MTEQGSVGMDAQADANQEQASRRCQLPVEMQILEVFGRANVASVGPTDLERMLGGTKGTYSAKLKALADAGYLTLVGTGRYTPGGKMFTLGMSYLLMLMNHMDQVEQMMSVNMRAVREMVQQFAAMMPAGGRT